MKGGAPLPPLGISLSPRENRALIILSHLEEVSRHKANPNLPVFDARNELGLDAEVQAAA